ncbi:MAG: TetR family transcriptional regulator [Pseudonocardiales bacterium]|nr:TetR family transcriptional regulator [Pseudonocardiales bacterium]
MSSGVRAARRAESARRILEAARVEFAANGFDGATIRAIASRAGVDPSLVMQHHGSKAALFRSAVQLDAFNPGQVETHLHEVVDERIAGLPPELHALVRSMLTVPEATAAMRDYLDERVINLAQAMDGDDTEVRAALTVCAILGLTVGRHFLHLGAFENTTNAQIARVARTWMSTVSDPTKSNAGEPAP